MKLYIYDHCPYCVKARMIFGLKKVSVQLVCFSNDDEKTPKSMIGEKMVPILEKANGTFMPESLDIISYIDKQQGTEEVSWKNDRKLSAWLSKNSMLCYELAMPRWVQAPLDEFKSKKARDYFQKKKEDYIGSFKVNLNNTKKLAAKMEKELELLASMLNNKQKFFTGGLSINDFHLFSFLRSVSLVKAVSFSSKIKYYSKAMSEQSRVPLHHSISI